ncbi:MAG: hypothetical protein JRE43_11785 [Deltaproteobacteria bacterium]|jgi:hypothetical protein|nr:hypothetical protein [Deltaproteobacteria bacterium]
MNWAKRSVSWIGCASLPAMLFVAFLLLGQFVALSHSVDHDSEPSDCMVCRISKPHEQLIVALSAARVAVPAEPTDPVFVQAQPGVESVICDTLRERAPPVHS